MTTMIRYRKQENKTGAKTIPTEQFKQLREPKKMQGVLPMTETEIIMAIRKHQETVHIINSYISL